MKRLVLTTFASVLCVVSVLAMPTKSELAKAQPLVVELMTPVMAEFKAAGAKDKAAAAVKVADTSVEFCKSAETEAAKFLLLKGAINFYTRGEAYDKAADAVMALQAGVKDVTPEVIAELTGKATIKISEAKAPRLFAICRSSRLKVRAANEAKAMAKKLKTVKSDALQRCYAEALAVSGDWKAAYAAFGQLKDAKLKAIAEAEANDQAKNAESGEFWWTYEPAMEDTDDFFKSHAAAFYRKALDAGEITGLKKNIVEQRIAGIAAEASMTKEGDNTIVQATQPVSVKVGKDSPLTIKGNVAEARTESKASKMPETEKTVSSSAKKNSLKPLSVLLKRDLSFDFVPCPAGEFEMGCSVVKDAPTYCHRVKITRPFWMSRYQVTRKIWNEFSNDLRLDDLKIECGGMNAPIVDVPYLRVCEFCDWLNHRWKGKCDIPKDYVFRLPTDAEWEYALNAGGNASSVYHRWLNGDMACAPEIMVVKEDYDKIAQKSKVKFGKPYHNPPLTVGLKKPNDWGVFDMLGNGSEFVLDRVPRDGWSTSLPIDSLNDKSVLIYADEETDPLRYVELPKKYDKNANCCAIVRLSEKCVVNTKIWYAKGRANIFWGYGMGAAFHLVIGPDLVSEWKTKHGKK